MKIIVTIFAITALAFAPASNAEKAGGILVYKYNSKLQTAGLDAVINLDPIESVEETRGCMYGARYLVIDEIAYDGVSEIIGGIRSSGDLYRIDSEDLYRNVSNAERGWLKDLFKKGQKVLVSYSVCGSGGLQFVRDTSS